MNNSKLTRVTDKTVIKLRQEIFILRLLVIFMAGIGAYAAFKCSQTARYWQGQGQTVIQGKGLP